MAYSNNTSVSYYMTVAVNNMQCTGRLNGMYLFSEVLPIPKRISFGHTISEYVDEKENILTLDVNNIAEYVGDGVDQGYCDVRIVAMVKNPQTQEIESKEVNHIRLTYVPRLEEESSYKYAISTQASNLSIEPQLAENQIIIEELKPIYDASKRPVERIKASRKFFVNHSQPYSWVKKSTPFEDTPANRQLLWEKYNEIRSVIIQKDKKAFRKLVDLGVTDVALAQGDRVEDRFDIVFDQIVQEFFDITAGSPWQSMPLTLDDYDLELYANGKLFRLNERRYALVSPLQWKNLYGKDTLRYNPLFTYVDGKIVIATF